MELGDIIRIFRIANNYSTKEVAKSCGLSSTYVSEVENSNKIPALKSLKLFACCFKVPSSTIIRIYEQSEEEDWNFQKTLFEILKIYVGE